MSISENFTPRQAAAQSARHYQAHELAVKAVTKAREVIDKSAHDAEDVALNETRRASAAWHIEWWSSRMLPDALKQLEATDVSAARDYHSNEAAYYQAAFAEAMLDGVEIHAK